LNGSGLAVGRALVAVFGEKQHNRGGIFFSPAPKTPIGGGGGILIKKKPPHKKPKTPNKTAVSFTIHT